MLRGVAAGAGDGAGDDDERATAKARDAAAGRAEESGVAAAVAKRSSDDGTRAVQAFVSSPQSCREGAGEGERGAFSVPAARC